MPFFPPGFPPPGGGLPPGYPPGFHPPVNPFRVFYVLTGVSFFAFVTGFSVCLFDLNQVKECVDYAEAATAVLKKMGDHILAWFVAVVQEILSRN